MADLSAEPTPAVRTREVQMGALNLASTRARVPQTACAASELDLPRPPPCCKLEADAAPKLQTATGWGRRAQKPTGSH